MDGNCLNQDWASKGMSPALVCGSVQGVGLGVGWGGGIYDCVPYGVCLACL